MIQAHGFCEEGFAVFIDGEAVSLGCGQIQADLAILGHGEGDGDIAGVCFRGIAAVAAGNSLGDGDALCIGRGSILVDLPVYRRFQACGGLEEQIQKLEATGRWVVHRQGGQFLPSQEAQGKVSGVFQKGDIPQIVHRLEQVAVQDSSVPADHVLEVQKQRRHRRSLFKAVPVVGWFGPIPQGCHKFGH